MTTRQISEETLQGLSPLVEEFLAAAIVDDGYAVKIARQAVNIRNKRAAMAAKREARTSD